MSDCNSNPYDPRCACPSRHGSSKKRKVYDVASQRYSCCGVWGYSGYLHNDSCQNWEEGLEDETTVTGVGYGPTNSFLMRKEKLQTLSSYFPLAASQVLNGKIVFTCQDGKTPRILSYNNLNAGLDNSQAVVCVTTVATGGTLDTEGHILPPYTTDDFALFQIAGCEDDSDRFDGSCTISGNAPVPVKMDFQSVNYPGISSVTGNTETIMGISKNSFYIIVIAIVVAILMAILLKLK